MQIVWENVRDNNAFIQQLPQAGPKTVQKRTWQCCKKSALRIVQEAWLEMLRETV